MQQWQYMTTYKSGFRAKRDHRLQVEAYCNVLQKENGEEIKIRYAGLIYGFWEKKNEDDDCLMCGS